MFAKVNYNSVKTIQLNNESSTKPVIDYYDQKGLVTHIDAAQKPEKVFEDIKKALEKNA